MAASITAYRASLRDADVKESRRIRRSMTLSKPLSEPAGAGENQSAFASAEPSAAEEP